MSTYTYTEKVDLLWAAFQEQLEKIEIRKEAEEKGVHPQTLRTQRKYAPPLEGDELAQAKSRWPKGKYVSSQMYSVLLPFQDEETRIHQARRHCYWLNQDGFIFYDPQKRGYTDVLGSEEAG